MNIEQFNLIDYLPIMVSTLLAGFIFGISTEQGEE